MPNAAHEGREVLSVPLHPAYGSPKRLVQAATGLTHVGPELLLFTPLLIPLFILRVSPPHAHSDLCGYVLG